LLNKSMGGQLETLVFWNYTRRCDLLRSDNK
jgi:hypothetical protein